MCWLNDNAGAIQAICAVLGLIGLATYCWFTHGIRKASISQQKAAQAPMIMFFEGKNAWAIKNYGVGPAVHVWWQPNTGVNSKEPWYELGALAAGDESDLPHHSRPNNPELMKMYDDGAQIRYSDMAGNNYATSGVWKDGAFIQNWEEIPLKER